MTFKPRTSGVQVYHHIYAWGNDRHPIFKDQTHYERYLRLLSEYSLSYEINAIAYALMEWHVHLFIYDLNDKISDFMRHLHGDYALFYNRNVKRVGHVFGERFNNRIVQPNNYGLWLSRYIHRQAVEAGLVNDPKDYPWTSYRVYIGLERSNFLKPDIILRQFGIGEKARRLYEAFVMGNDDGPIDWKKTKQFVIGERDFIEDFKDEKNIGATRVSNKIAIKDLVTDKMGLNWQWLLRPEGIEQRRRRHNLVRKLLEEYGYTKSEVARAFNISVTAVTYILRQNFKT